MQILDDNVHKKSTTTVLFRPDTSRAINYRRLRHLLLQFPIFSEYDLLRSTVKVYCPRTAVLIDLRDVYDTILDMFSAEMSPDSDTDEAIFRSLLHLRHSSLTKTYSSLYFSLWKWFKMCSCITNSSRSILTTVAPSKHARRTICSVATLYRFGVFSTKILQSPVTFVRCWAHFPSLII